MIILRAAKLLRINRKKAPIREVKIKTCSGGAYFSDEIKGQSVKEN